MLNLHCDDEKMNSLTHKINQHPSKMVKLKRNTIIITSVYMHAYQCCGHSLICQSLLCWKEARGFCHQPVGRRTNEAVLLGTELGQVPCQPTQRMKLKRVRLHRPQATPGEKIPARSRWINISYSCPQDCSYTHTIYTWVSPLWNNPLFNSGLHSK